MRLGVAFVLSLSAAAGITWAACGPRDAPGVGGFNGDGGSSSSENTGASTATGFETDGAAICGSDVHTPVTHPPLIYFVIDRSASMTDFAEGSTETRYDRVREAARDMVADLGALVRTGAAVFPHLDADEGDECLTGAEVYAPKVGASPSNFESAIDDEPFGGTPISATLVALQDNILEEEAPRAVILATDGAPNCNPDARCNEDTCMVNLAGECPADIGNCCDPANGGTWLNCVDRQATILAVQALANAGADVYVVGIPGSEGFAAILDQLAIVGGVPQDDAETYYYRVDDLDALSGVFKGIAAELVSCTFDLADPPDAPGKTNVYFDEEVVLQDAENGWVWVDEDTIELVGDACAELKTGDVREIQIVSGCPTATPR